MSGRGLLKKEESGMIKYSYIAKGAGRLRVSSEIDAVSKYQALEELRGQGLTVLSISENGADSHDESDVVIRRRRKRVMGVSLAERAVFFRQFAVALSAGVPLREGLQCIVKDIENKIFRHALNDVIDKIHDGASFSEAIAHHMHIFDKSTVALLHAAEESGSMESTLERIASSLEHNSVLKRKLFSIISYPVFVAVFFLIVCVIITVFVMPQFQEVFTEFDAELPAITIAVFAINSFLLTNGLWIILAVLLAGVALWLFGRTVHGREVVDRCKLSLPFFGPLIRKLLIARMCRSLAMMVKGGVPMAYALELTAEISRNVILRKAMLDVHDKVVQGMSISEGIAESSLFPNLMLRMVSVGESSGKLPMVLDKVGETYEGEVEGSIMVAMALFEPIVIVAFGAVVLLLVLAIYMPVFTVAAGVK